MRSFQDTRAAEIELALQPVDPRSHEFFMGLGKAMLLNMVDKLLFRHRLKLQSALCG